MQMKQQAQRKQINRMVGPVWTQFGGSLRSHKGGEGGRRALPSGCNRHGFITHALLER